MIPDDFEYYRPTSIREAVQLDQTLRKQGKIPAYYSGGTEIITLTRINMFVTDAVIDIKGIPECNTFTEHDGADEKEIEKWLQSNICRCTGYKEIEGTVKSVLAKKNGAAE